MKISFYDAATTLEKICEEIETVDEITETLRETFRSSVEELESAIDRRIMFMKYAESQVEKAREMEMKWCSRAERFQRIIAGLKASTLDFMKAYPNMPYKGSLGSFKIRKNSQPALVIDEEQLDVPDDYFLKPDPELDRGRIKRDLIAGKKIPGASLEWGEHLRIEVS